MKSFFLSFFILGLFNLQVNAANHHPQIFLKSIQGTKNEGRQIYNHFCINCHDQKPLIPLGAPRFQMDADWSARLKQSLPTLFDHTDEGLNGMPPRGGCFECTDHQLILALVAMLPKSTQKDTLKKLKDYKKIK